MQEQISEEAAAAGLFEEDGVPAEAGPDAAAAGVAPSDVVVDAPPPPEDLTIEARYKVSGPNNKGYWCRDGAPLVRILWGQPRNSLSARCFQHRNCTWLLPLSKDPGDEASFEWLFEVAPTPPFTAQDIGQGLTRQHQAGAMRFRAGSGPPPAIRVGGGASSSSDLPAGRE